MPTQAIYKPVDGEQQTDSVVFTIEDFAEDGSSSHHTFVEEYEHQYDDKDNDDENDLHITSSASMLNMEISNSSFDDDFTEHLFRSVRPNLRLAFDR